MHRLPWTYLLALVALPVSLACAGCGATPPGASGGPEGEVCSRDSECSGSQTCRDGYCSVASGSYAGLDFEFDPPNDTLYAPQIAHDLVVRADESLDFALEPRVVVAGRIRFPGDNTVGPSGQLDFRRVGRDSHLLGPNVRVDSGSYKSRVHPGRYELALLPDSEEYPSRVWRDRAVTAAAGTQYDFTVPQPDELAVIQGRVTFNAESVEEREPPAVPDASIWAVSEDGRFRSTTAETDEEGDFRIRAFPRPGTYELVVSPSEDSALLPRTRIIREFTLDDTGDLKPEFVNLDLGAFPNVIGKTETFKASFELPPLSKFVDSAGPDDHLDGWRGTVVVATADLGGDRRFWRKVQVGDTDRVELELLPKRNYRVSIYPPWEHPVAATHFDIGYLGGGLAELSAGKLSEAMETKHQLSGRLVSRSGRPVEGAQLVFHPRDVEDRSRISNEIDRLTPRVTTNGDGEFSVRLEARDYDVLAKPIPGSGLPRKYIRLADRRVTDGEPLQIRLAEPLLVSGAIYGKKQDGAESLPSTQIEAYIERRGRRFVLGSTTTGRNGEFSVILPAEP